MRALRTASMIMVTSLLASCASAPEPIDLSATSEAATALSGEWHGEYHLTEGAGRYGSIFFRLSADGDTAVGDVMMVAPHTAPVRPTTPGEAGWGASGPQTQTLAIRFVRAAGDSLTGTLEPYRDPTCGCRLHTTFVGRIRGDDIEGTFRSLHVESGMVTHGTWAVHREHP